MELNRIRVKIKSVSPVAVLEVHYLGVEASVEFVLNRLKDHGMKAEQLHDVTVLKGKIARLKVPANGVNIEPTEHNLRTALDCEDIEVLDGVG
jgi:hypothetical protein